MMPTSFHRAGVMAVALLLAALAAGCKKAQAVSCTGIFCPAGWSCAQKVAQCIRSACGNGVRDPGEACDDGGAIDGDLVDPSTGERCSADCQSDETCGNTHIDEVMGEVCDPPGPDCSKDCKSSLRCGNHAVDPGEYCDPGENDIPLETEDCNIDCSRQRCGDGKVNLAAREECDRDGDGVPGATGESTTCDSDCSFRTCGDRQVNAVAGEECDDGAANSFEARCLPGTCTLNVCGDGHVNRAAEDCDAGPQDATYKSPDCEYGTTCEVCSRCQRVGGRTHNCGDGVKDEGHEACDDGVDNGRQTCAYGQSSCFGCSADCQTVTELTGPLCGDSIVNPGEACDSWISVACMTCGTPYTANACRRVALSAASGSIRIVTVEGLAGVTFSLAHDSGNEPRVFQYVLNESETVDGNIPIEIRGASVNTVANRTAQEIEDALDIRAEMSEESTVRLQNERQGVVGNVPIEVGSVAGMDPAPRTDALQVRSMTGGVGCGFGQQCQPGDCISGLSCYGGRCWNTH